MYARIDGPRADADTDRSLHALSRAPRPMVRMDDAGLCHVIHRRGHRLLRLRAAYRLRADAGRQHHLRLHTALYRWPGQLGHCDDHLVHPLRGPFTPRLYQVFVHARATCRLAQGRLAAEAGCVPPLDLGAPAHRFVRSDVDGLRARLLWRVAGRRFRSMPARRRKLPSCTCGVAVRARLHRGRGRQDELRHRAERDLRVCTCTLRTRA
mmetsp:Transcript_26382/g.66963  ORF Transcript_26382/g.66963 Transcript_26382/m.66963 type:complete len:209 (-) Transcript_26382:2211-2837(-)